MIDNKFTEELQQYLNDTNATTNNADRVEEGAMLLVRINPRNAAYRRYLDQARRGATAILKKIIYELKMHLRYRLDGLTRDAVIILDRQITAAMQQHFGTVDTGNIDTDDNTDTDAPTTADVITKGRRADHDTLPKKIQRLWTDAADLWKQMHAAFEELKQMNDLPACQRYDKLKYLDSADKKYRRLLADYDAYQPKPSKKSTAAKK